MYLWEPIPLVNSLLFARVMSDFFLVYFNDTLSKQDFRHILIESNLSTMCFVHLLYYWEKNLDKHCTLATIAEQERIIQNSFRFIIIGAITSIAILTITIRETSSSNLLPSPSP